MMIVMMIVMMMMMMMMTINDDGDGDGADGGFFFDLWHLVLIPIFFPSSLPSSLPSFSAFSLAACSTYFSLDFASLELFSDASYARNSSFVQL